MDAVYVDLWRRICAFQLDGAGDELTFTTRLARENGWSIGYTSRVVDEYRRFVFLAMTAGHEVLWQLVQLRRRWGRRLRRWGWRRVRRLRRWLEIV